MGRTVGKMIMINYVLSLLLILAGIIVRITFTGYRALGYTFIFFGGLILLFRLVRGNKRLKRFFIILLTVFLAIFLVTEAFVIADAVKIPEKGADYIIVLGAGVNRTTPSLSLRNRIDATYAYLVDNPDTICIASGGQGGGEDITEAQCIKNSLVSMGIEEERILLEEKATSTEENIAFSLKIIKETGIEDPKIGICSSEYHIARARLMAKNHRVHAIGIPGKTTLPILMINYFIREVPAIWYYLVL